LIWSLYQALCLGVPFWYSSLGHKAQLAKDLRHVVRSCATTAEAAVHPEAAVTAAAAAATVATTASTAATVATATATAAAAATLAGTAGTAPPATLAGAVIETWWTYLESTAQPVPEIAPLALRRAFCDLHTAILRQFGDLVVHVGDALRLRVPQL
jgi:hypothetical protein